MSRVGNNRGKSLGTVIEQQYRYKDNEKFGGAIKKEKHVLAIDRKMQWKLAQIIEVRYEVPYDEEAEFWDPSDLADAATGETHTDEPMSGQQQSAGSGAHEEAKCVPEGAGFCGDVET